MAFSRKRTFESISPRDETHPDNKVSDDPEPLAQDTDLRALARHQLSELAAIQDQRSAGWQSEDDAVDEVELALEISDDED